MLSQDEFTRYGEAGFNLVPLWKVLPLPERLDPLDVYRALANRRDDYLFETGEWGNAVFTRHYSTIGLPCSERIELDEDAIRHLRHDHVESEQRTDDPLAALRRLQEGFRVPHFDALPPFSGGLFGYFGFETTRLIEPRLRRVARKPSGLQVPDVVKLVSRELVVIDHRRRQLFCIVHEDPREAGGHARGTARLEAIVAQVQALDAAPERVPGTTQGLTVDAGRLSFGFAREAYEGAVDRIKDYIAAGDVMQVVLAQRMSRPLACDATALYRALGDLAQTPYRYVVNLGECAIVGASPEMLVQQRGDIVTSRPMAGTRRRTQDDAEDARLKEELLADPKEIAEHMMLVDLARNDVGRLAVAGGVQVDELLTVEYFSHVMHIVSTVTGKLPGQVNGLDVLRSTFPAGTLSGASKVRALEVIAELEPHSRGIYGGAVGYLDWRGQAELAITIRTGVLQGGLLHVQSGAGVVKDSVAEREWQETMDKSRMMLLAAELAERQSETETARPGAAQQEATACI
ncbi:anthranilate synthase component I family protein [Burkholderia plantarii]|uniref:anthranilate synthase component I family protein n=1 Tax=Burkholderia plantarii TaxID=41899 RepID=UPI000870B07A|nr:anthranilate synthase component I family protein [Burkholderia plantarii]